MRGRKTIEDYLKTIYILSRKKEVHACMIADQLGVSRPTVSVFLRHLEADGFLTIDSSKAISLTPKGLEIAQPVYERYEILQRFLIRLGVDEKTAFHDACEMEHGLGDKSYQALKNLALQMEEKDQA